MDITYRREMKHNYMIIEPGETGYESYETHMMASNGIEGLLKFHIKQVDMRRFYYYEITSKQPLSRILECHSMGGEELRKLISGIAQTLGRLEIYLLQENQIILEPEYIYIEPEQFAVSLCLVPGGQGRFTEKMTGLLQYLLGKVNHQDKECVVMAYALYQESLKENYGMNDLLEIMGKEYEEKKEKCEEIENKEMEYKEMKYKEMEYTESEHSQDKKNSWSEDLKNLEKVNRWVGNKIFIRSAMAAILTMAGTVVILWIFFGTEGIGKFWYVVPATGVLAAIAVFIGTGEMFSASGESTYKGKERQCQQEEARDWQIAFDEGPDAEQEEGRKDKKEKEIEEPVLQTVLLAEPDEDKNIRYLRAVEPAVGDIPITYVPYLIGKQEGLVDKVLNSDTISRIHARIDREGEEYRISDLNSTNGTSVNGRLLEMNETAALKKGDEVLIAEFAFIFT